MDIKVGHESAEHGTDMYVHRNMMCIFTMNDVYSVEFVLYS